jgi:hypothetical protein
MVKSDEKAYEYFFDEDFASFDEAESADGRFLIIEKIARKLSKVVRCDETDDIIDKTLRLAREIDVDRLVIGSLCQIMEKIAISGYGSRLDAIYDEALNTASGISDNNDLSESIHYLCVCAQRTRPFGEQFTYKPVLERIKSLALTLTGKERKKSIRKITETLRYYSLPREAEECAKLL